MGLEIVEVIMRLEEEFDIEIPDEDAERLTTVGQIADYVAEKLMLPEDQRERHWNRVQAIVVDEANVPAEQVHRETRLVEDLNLG